MRKLQLTLHAKDIKLAVKADTFITGQIDKSVDMEKNAALAYNEQAGDEQYHEVKLYRTMRGAVSKFEASMAEYVESSSSSSSVEDDLTAKTADEFTISFTVGSRYNGAYSNTIASLAQEYIINMMLYTWWLSIKPSLAKDYLSFAMENLSYIRRCLSKTAPDDSNGSYSDVTGSTTPIEDGDFGNNGSSGEGGSNPGTSDEEDLGTLLQTAYCSYDAAAILGLSDEGHLLAMTYKIATPEKALSPGERLTLKYSGSDTIFRYIFTHYGIDGEELDGTPKSGTLSEIASEMGNKIMADNNYPACLIWPDNKMATGQTIKLYRK